jgi:hypothetical protein
MSKLQEKPYGERRAWSGPEGPGPWDLEIQPLDQLNPRDIRVAQNSMIFRCKFKYLNSL